jgi:hypothetical protein
MGNPYENPAEGAFRPNYGAPFSGASSNPESPQTIIDNEHLRLLRIGYFISAAQTALLIPLGLMYSGMGILFSFLPGGHAGSPPAFMSWAFGIFGGIFAGFAILGATLKLLTAIRLKERRSRTLCLITAALSCLEMPYGTALGVFTFIVLSRPAVRQAFEEMR